MIGERRQAGGFTSVLKPRYGQAKRLLTAMVRLPTPRPWRRSDGRLFIAFAPLGGGRSHLAPETPTPPDSQVPVRPLFPPAALIAWMIASRSAAETRAAEAVPSVA
jgi:hypothetical protein